ncbi:endoribonuclease Dicer-like [Mya arenaria]|uniref:endoribonuclease Dicer-like n=1 Tax=Mya arenaria TaxID=6604 RepID=UPI0022E2C5EF|nr:endoribonuclease Dicer-like [Mya arenaria]
MAYTRRIGGRPNPKRLPRHLRNEDIPRNIFTPKTYQVELLETALQQNTVVCMGSMSGRMFIAVMMMKEKARQVRSSLENGGKRSIFLVHDDEVIDQVTPFIKHPCDLAVAACKEADGWTIEQWKLLLDESQVLIIPCSVFLQLLSKKTISLDMINLLIFYDCNRVLTEAHPYQEIMQIYNNFQKENCPRILGLTSNILEGRYQNPKLLDGLITSLEKALNSRAETASLVIPERYGIKPVERVIECPDYEDTTELNDQIYLLLENSIEFLEECNIEISEELDNRDPRLIPKAALIECHNILTQLGPWCAACLADMLVNQIEKIEKQKETVAMHKKFFKLGATTLRMVSKIFENHFKQCPYTLEDLLKYSTPKVAALLECLRKYRPKTDFIIISEDLDMNAQKEDSDTDMSDDSDEFSENDDDEDDDDDDDDDDESQSPNSRQIHFAIKKVNPEDELKAADPFALDEDKCLCGIVFVEHQHEAFALSKFIEEACSWDEELCFVKSTHMTGNKSSAKRQKLYKKQEETLRKFRMQDLNLLISTSVLEEGVDVPKCNFVARFDIPKSYRSYSHSKGRARSRDAEYVILIEEEHFDGFESELKQYHEIEKVLINRNARLIEPEDEDQSDCSCDHMVPPFVPPSEERLGRCASMETAIMLVNRYCAKLPSDAFTHLTPSCRIRELQSGEKTMYVASVRLPINSPVKMEIEGVPMPTKQKARQAVAVQICKILHQRGELDNDLMPLGKEMLEGVGEGVDDPWADEEDAAGEARPGTTKRKQYYCKKVASALQQTVPSPGTPCNLYVITMILTGPITEDQNTRGRKIDAPDETTRSIGIITPKTIPLVPMFPVFTRSGEVTVSVDLLSSEVTLSEEKLEKLKTFHRFLFSNVLRLEKDPMDYFPTESIVGYVVVPLDVSGGSNLDIDWTYTDKVVESVNSTPKAHGEDYMFEFRAEDFEDAVVMPAYRNIDQPQYFYVAEIRPDLNPLSPFPSPELYKTFAEYYASKYGLAISNLEQPLLDVDHTSARLNLLIPRYMNQKGVPLPTSSAETKKARRENLQQKQILIPELCDVHVFPASLWRKAVCLPAILYRLNYLLLGEEIRKHVAAETRIGVVELPEDYRFPKLDFGIDTSPENLKMLNGNSKDTDETDSTSDDGDKEEENLGSDIAKDDIPDDANEDENAMNEKSAKEEVDKSDENIDENKEESAIDATRADDVPNCNKSIENISETFAKLCKTCDRDPCIEKCSKCNKSVCVDAGVAKFICDNVNRKDANLTTFQENNLQFVYNINGATDDKNDGEADTAKEGDEMSLVNGDLKASETQDEQNRTENGKLLQETRSDNINEVGDSGKKCFGNDDDEKENERSRYLSNGYVRHDNQTLEIADDLIEEPSNKEVENGHENTNETEQTEDVFSNIATFLTDKEKRALDDDFCPEPLISLDIDMNLKEFIGPSPCEILQALTMSNANDFYSLERLETIGDSFLKYAITVYLFCSYPGIHEGKLSYLRSKQVSNFNLYRLGKRKGLAECMISTKFEPYENWLPPGYVINEDKRKGPVSRVHVVSLGQKSLPSSFQTQLDCIDISLLSTTSSQTETEVDTFQSELDAIDLISKEKDEEEFAMEDKPTSLQNLLPYCLQLHHCLPDKSIADCVEALIGCYLTSCDKMAALKFMSWMGLKVLPKENMAADGYDEDLRPVRLPPPASPMDGADRTACDLLTRLLDGYEGFEERIGYTFRDRSYLLQAFTHASYHFNTITDCYQRLEFLGDAVLDYVITRHLYEDSDKYSPGVLTDLRSALVNNNIFAALAVKWDFHKYFKAISPSLFHVIEKFVARQKEKEDEIDDEDEEADEDHEKEHVELEVPKALGDIFESVAGAVYLDSGMSLDTVWRVFYRIMKPQIDKYLQNIPKSPVRELLEQEPETAKFEKPERTMAGKIRVTVNVVGKGVFTGVGRNYRIAKSAAAKKALRCIKTLENQGLI